MQQPSVQSSGSRLRRLAAIVRSRVRSKLLVRLLLSAFFLLLAYETVSASELLTTLRQLQLSTIALLMVLYTVGQCFSSLRWRIFLSEAGIRRPSSEILRAFFFGMFVNAFGFGTVGGDLARSLAVRPTAGQRLSALATVVADRLYGLITLLSIGAVAVVIVQPEIMGGWALPGALLTIAALGLFWWFGPAALVALFPEGHRFGEAARAAAHAFPREPVPMLLATLLSMTMHTIQIFMHYLIARELGADLSFAYLCATVPLVNTASSLPLSMNGIGVREAMYVLLFVPAGISRETAVAFGAIWLLTVTFVGAVGGFLLRPRFELSLGGKTVESPPEAAGKERMAIGG